MEPMKNIPVYRHSAAYAVEHGELEAYKTSRVAGVACRDAIEKAVAKHYRDNCLNKAGAREVIDEFGKERVRQWWRQPDTNTLVRTPGPLAMS